jgi:hypothetical protein
MPDRPLLQRLRWKAFAVAAYLLLGLAGISALQTPSISLEQQGGIIIIFAWSSCCIFGMLLGLCGFIFRKVALEIIGIGLLTAASLTWATAVILQAMSGTNSVARTVTAICLALTVAALLAQRWLDVSRPPNR